MTPAPPVPPSWIDPITAALEVVVAEVTSNVEGAAADYIPELAQADPTPFGLALASLEGNLYRAGDADLAFTIQSISKPFVLALAVADVGFDAVVERIGVEPTGDPFDALTLEPGTGRAPNPLVNAGALVATSLVAGRDPAEQIARIGAVLSGFAGRSLEIDHQVAASELATADRNRALAYLLRGAGTLSAEVEATLEAYVAQCAHLVSATDLAIMGATLANRGRNPVTGEVVVEPAVATTVLSIMATCGMYDASGRWLLEVGLPAKSGVAGGLVATAPGQFGFGAFSPRLDSTGNSVRAVAACRSIAERFSLHVLAAPPRGTAALYLSGRGIELGGSPTRSPAERAVLESAPRAIAVRALQGDLEFVDVEPLLHRLGGRLLEDGTQVLVLDLHRTTRLHPVAEAMLTALLRRVQQLSVALVLVDPDRRLDRLSGVRSAPNLEAALRLAEELVLAAA